MPALSGVDVADDDAAEAVRTTAVIKLNGGLGTSMGMERAKSLLCVRRGLSFLDIIARQVLHLRKEYDATLPLIFMNSFRTSADTMAALARYDALPVDGPAAGVPAEQGTQAARQGPLAGLATPRTRRSSGVRPDTATSTPHCSAPGCSTSSSTPATSGCSSPTPTTSARSRTPGSPAGSRPRVRRSRSRPCAVRPPTARAATSRAARATAGSCCARPPRRSRRTSSRWPTSSGTGSARPTTCGSTWPR